MNITVKRILGNWMTSFLSPLIGGGIVFNLQGMGMRGMGGGGDGMDMNMKILLTALISSSIVTGLIIARTLEYGRE